MYACVLVRKKRKSGENLNRRCTDCGASGIYVYAYMLICICGHVFIYVEIFVRVYNSGRCTRI